MDYYHLCCFLYFVLCPIPRIYSQSSDHPTNPSDNSTETSSIINNYTVFETNTLCENSNCDTEQTFSSISTVIHGESSKEDITMSSESEQSNEQIKENVEITLYSENLRSTTMYNSEQMSQNAQSIEGTTIVTTTSQNNVGTPSESNVSWLRLDGTTAVPLLSTSQTEDKSVTDFKTHLTTTESTMAVGISVTSVGLVESTKTFHTASVINNSSMTSDISSTDVFSSTAEVTTSSVSSTDVHSSMSDVTTSSVSSTDVHSSISDITTSSVSSADVHSSMSDVRFSSITPNISSTEIHSSTKNVMTSITLNVSSTDVSLGMNDVTAPSMTTDVSSTILSTSTNDADTSIISAAVSPITPSTLTKTFSSPMTFTSSNILLFASSSEDNMTTETLTDNTISSREIITDTPFTKNLTSTGSSYSLPTSPAKEEIGHSHEHSNSMSTSQVTSIIHPETTISTKFFTSSSTSATTAKVTASNSTNSRINPPIETTSVLTEETILSKSTSEITSSSLGHMENAADRSTKNPNKLETTELKSEGDAESNTMTNNFSTSISYLPTIHIQSTSTIISTLPVINTTTERPLITISSDSFLTSSISRGASISTHVSSLYETSISSPENTTSAENVPRVLPTEYFSSSVTADSFSGSEKNVTVQTSTAEMINEKQNTQTKIPLSSVKEIRPTETVIITSTKEIEIPKRHFRTISLDNLTNEDLDGVVTAVFSKPAEYCGEEWLQNQTTLFHYWLFSTIMQKILVSPMNSSEMLSVVEIDKAISAYVSIIEVVFLIPTPWQTDETLVFSFLIKLNDTTSNAIPGKILLPLLDLNSDRILSLLKLPAVKFVSGLRGIETDFEDDNKVATSDFIRDNEVIIIAVSLVVLSAVVTLLLFAICTRRKSRISVHCITDRIRFQQDMHIAVEVGDINSAVVILQDEIHEKPEIKNGKLFALGGDEGWPVPIHQLPQQQFDDKTPPEVEDTKL